MTDVVNPLGYTRVSSSALVQMLLFTPNQKHASVLVVSCVSVFQPTSLRWNPISTPKFLLCSVVTLAGNSSHPIHQLCGVRVVPPLTCVNQERDEFGFDHGVSTVFL